MTQSISLNTASKTQPSVAQILVKQANSGTLPGTMLFCGPKRSSKLFTAYSLAKDLGSVKNGNFALSSNRDFSVQINFAINSYESKPTISTRDLLVDNFTIFLSQFTNVLATEALDQKVYDIASEISDLISEINSVESNVSKYCNKLSTLFASCLTAIGKKNQVLNVNQVRSLQKWLNLTSLSNSPKIVVIESIEDANESTRNSLLKILEEPPKDVYFILTSSSPEKIMSTILSRSRKYLFGPVLGEAKNKLLATWNVDGNNYDSLEDFFSRYVDNTQLSDLAKWYLGSVIGDSFVNSFYSVTSLNSLSLNSVLDAIDSQRTLQSFFREVIHLVEEGFRKGSICMDDASFLLKQFNSISSKSSVFNQNPKLCLEALYYQLKRRSF